MDPIIDLGGATALVTGAGQGVGRATCLFMARSNAGAIIVNDYFVDRAEAVADEVRALGVRAVAICSDVTSFDGVGAMFGAIPADVPPVTVLVNNAGNGGVVTSGADPAPFWESEPAEWAAYLDVNLAGVMNCTRWALKAMVEQGRGRIVTVISDAGRTGEAANIAYSAAKAGAAGLTRAIAKAVGRNGVTANCVSLGAIRTAAIAQLLEDQELMKKIVRAYPMRRIGEPEDPAALITFLASEAASWITGQVYPVNGGFSFAQ